MPDIPLTTGRARKNSSYNSHCIFRGDERRVNEKILVKHFKLLCRRTLYKYRAILLVILMSWEFLLLEKVWIMLVLLCCIFFAAPQRYFKLLTFYYLWILGMWLCTSEFQRESLILNGFWIPWLQVAVGRWIIYYCHVQTKVTMKKANAELENITLWLGWWLQKSQGKPSYYNNSAVALPLLSQAIKGKANHYRFNQRAKLWRMTIHSSFHVTAKSYLGALNSKAVLSLS